MNDLAAPHFLDIVCLAISAGLFTFYHLYVRWKLKTNPIYSLYGATTLAKTAWVVNVMEEKNDLLAVQTLGNYGSSMTFVAMQLNKAGGYFHNGMRAYYFLVPLIFWLFGPLLMVLATAVLVVIIFRIEKTPKLDCGYLASFFRQSCQLPRD